MTRLLTALCALVLLVIGLVLWPVPTSGQAPATMFVAGSSGAVPLASTHLGFFPAASTTTARNLSGAALADKGGRFSIVSTPAVSTLGSASIAAEAGVRHVADCATFSAGSTTAPVLTKLTVSLRDGATGAGTIITSWTVVIPAGTGQNVAPYAVCGLNLAGTTNTAMTLEFSALLTNLFEDVTLTGFNVN